MTDLGTPQFGLHPLHGVHEPTLGNPPRRFGSVRRTTSIDMTREVGSLDPVYLVGHARDLRYLLLDDVPVATLISGHALSAANLVGDVAKSGYVPVAVQCADFATGGLLMTSSQAGDPAIVTGPVAPDLENDDDPWAWHPVPTLTPGTMRRRRRIDVFVERDGRIGIDAMFRDTYVRTVGVERITGMTLGELHFRVRRELFGTSTCTHLNDLLRSVADAEA